MQNRDAPVAIKVASRDIRFYTFDGDDRQHEFLSKPSALSYITVLQYDRLYDIFSKLVRQNSKLSDNVRQLKKCTTG